MALLPLYAAIFLMLGLTSASSCDQCVHPGKVTKFHFVSEGTCGFGSIAPGLNGGNVAAASSALYRGGVGCGACFNLKCKDKNFCSRVGTNVVVTDINLNNRTDFVLSSSAFAAMALAGKANELNKRPIIDVEYRRVPCSYKKNLSIRVEKGSIKPSNLVVTFLYQGGQTDILGVDAVQDGSSDFRYMTQKNGAVWETKNAPAGPTQFRVVVLGGYDMYPVESVRALPADWKVGVIYDLGVQITAVAQDGCSHCDPAVNVMK